MNKPQSPFVVGKRITWCDEYNDNRDTWERTALTILSGTIVSMTPQKVDIIVDTPGYQGKIRRWKFEILNGVDDHELHQAIQASIVIKPKTPKQPNDTQEIYRLDDPTDGSTFYVGRSKNASKRFKQHLHPDGINPQKDARIQSLLKCGLQPVLVIMETVKGSQYGHLREAYWIQHYHTHHASLTNLIVDELIEQTRKLEKLGVQG